MESISGKSTEGGAGWQDLSVEKKGWIESYLKAVLGRWRGGLVEEWESMWIGGRRVFLCVFYVQ